MPLISSQFSTQVKNLNRRESLPAYLGRRFNYKTFDQWCDVIDKGLIDVNNFPAKKDTVLHKGDNMVFRVVDYAEPPVPCDFRVLSKQGPLTFIHKPPGLPVHRTGKIFFNTLVNLVRASSVHKSLVPLHRLDAETSGVLAFSEDAGQSLIFARQSADKFWLKMYLALVPCLKGPREGIINMPLQTVAGSDIRCQMHPVTGGKQSLTCFKEIARDGVYSLLCVAPITGRKHQIRAHLAQQGYPIVGDKIYSHGGCFYLKRLRSELKEEDFRTLGSAYHKLHTFYLEYFRGDFTKYRVVDENQIPQRFGNLFANRYFKWRQNSGFNNYRAELCLIMRKYYRGEYNHGQKISHFPV